MEIINDIVAFMQNGFQEVNAVQGLIIALIAAALLGSYGRILFVAVGATVVHVLVDVMLPVLAKSGPFKLPPLVDQSFWHYVAVLFVGYVVVISAFYVVKRLLFGGFARYEHG